MQSSSDQYQEAMDAFYQAEQRAINNYVPLLTSLRLLRTHLTIALDTKDWQLVKDVLETINDKLLIE